MVLAHSVKRLTCARDHVAFPGFHMTRRGFTIFEWSSFGCDNAGRIGPVATQVPRRSLIFGGVPRHFRQNRPLENRHWLTFDSRRFRRLHCSASTLQGARSFSPPQAAQGAVAIVQTSESPIGPGAASPPKGDTAENSHGCDVDELLNENRRLRELVIYLSGIIIRDVVGRK